MQVDEILCKGGRGGGRSSSRSGSRYKSGGAGYIRGGGGGVGDLPWYVWLVIVTALAIVMYTFFSVCCSFDDTCCEEEKEDSDQDIGEQAGSSPDTDLTLHLSVNMGYLTKSDYVGDGTYSGKQCHDRNQDQPYDKQFVQRDASSCAGHQELPFELDSNSDYWSRFCVSTDSENPVRDPSNYSRAMCRHRNQDQSGIGFVQTDTSNSMDDQASPPPPDYNSYMSNRPAYDDPKTALEN